MTETDLTETPSLYDRLGGIFGIVVIVMGRARFRPVSMIAVFRSTPPCIASTAKSTSMIAFLVTMPISIRMPMTTGVVIGRLVMRSAKIAPAIDSGRENRMVTGCSRLVNNTASTT